MRTVLLILAGMIIMFILLKVMSSGKESNSQSWQRIKSLLATQQFNNLIKTNEFRELAKTNEFRGVVGSLASDQVLTISKTLVG